jgi:hypothetical protein
MNATAIRQRRQLALGPSDPRRSRDKRQGLSPEAVRAAMQAQGGLCAICARPLGALFTVDHDHFLAERHGHDPRRGCPSCFRGILHTPCNTALGAFNDDPIVLRRAADYIERRR